MIIAFVKEAFITAAIVAFLGLLVAGQKHVHSGACEHGTDSPAPEGRQAKASP